MSARNARGRYVGRFAPSPTGLLHAGSLVAALASWLDARAHGGQWLVRLENIDTPRCVAGADEAILRQLAACALVPDAPPTWQSRRGHLYAGALAQLQRGGWAYACTCSRSDIARALEGAGVPRAAHAELVYPGTCRPAGFTPAVDTPGAPHHRAEAPQATARLRADACTGGDVRSGAPQASSGSQVGQAANFSSPSSSPSPSRTPAWRLRTQDAQGAAIVIDWHDRRLGAQRQDLARAVGDVVLRRADGLWAYQLAVVADDAAQGVTDVVRGADLADNTARQIHLQRVLGLPTPRYLHTPLVLAEDGQKLSKQTGARPLALRSDIEAVAALRRAARVLGLPAALCDGRDAAQTPTRWLALAVLAWEQQFAADDGMIASPATTPSAASPPTLNPSDSKMTTTASGLQYEDTTVGTGDIAKSGQSVTVHYTGWLSDPTQPQGRGQKFDSSLDRRDPFVFSLDAGMVIKGWDEGVQGMAVGGKRVLTIPAELGYGTRGAGGVIPPNATLVFEVTLLATK